MPTGLFGVRARTTISRGGTQAASADRARKKLGVPTKEAKGADLASATTTDIGAATEGFVDITGTVTTTSLGTAPAGTRRTLQYDGVLILTHNATSLILPGGANITTAAGDIVDYISLGSGNWVCTGYMSAAGSPFWTYGAQVATTSETSVVLTTAIGAGATEVEVIFRGVGTDGNNEPPIVELGHTTSTYIATGYVTINASIGGSTAAEENDTDGFYTQHAAGWNASDVFNGVIRLTRWDIAEHIWMAICHGHETTDNVAMYGYGEVDVTSALSSIRLHTPTQAAAFNAGEARIRWR